MVIAGLTMGSVFADTTYTVAISIQGLPATLSTRVYVDGQFNGTLNGGGTTVFTLSTTTNPPTHTIVVDSYVEGGNGTRYFEADTSWTVNGPGSHIFAYTTQYLLSVQTAYSTAGGGGWFDSGSSATVTITSGEVDENQGVRQIFTGWGGDATGTQTTSNGIIMNGPKTAVANWKTQFLLMVASDPGNVTGLTGTGWYDAAGQANFTAPVIVPVTSNTRLRFSHWSGEYNGQSASGVVSMDHPKTETAIYGAQYLLTVIYSPPSITPSYNETHAGWYDAGSDVQLGPPPTIINLSTVERLQFTGWTENTTQSTNPSYTVTMGSPRVVTLTYKTQYYVDVQSSYGSVTGAGWYDRGATATITAPSSSGTWPIPYLLTGWTVSPSTGNFTKTANGWVLAVNGPYVVQAEWSVDYVPIIELFGGLGASIIAVAVAVALTYRRGGLKRQPRRQKTGLAQELGGTAVCGNCGNNVPKAATFCEKCGAPMTSALPTQISPLDEKVYNYILKHEGTISVSEASAELEIPVERLKEITERLKNRGLLG
jgi:hypothetical protein